MVAASITQRTFAGRRCLITGGLGFIGSNLAHRLVELGARVLVVDSIIPAYGGNFFNIADIRGQVHVNISDVRDPHAYENGHVPGALNVSFVDVEIMANRILREPRPVVAYCACKDELTAARVALQLKRVGVKDIRVLAGGWDGWTAGGGKVERTPPPGR